jgi:CheY-like chemotaxis protein
MATLLLADDSVTIQRVIELTFADEGIRVIAVGDGETAIARFEQERPDIVLADVGMPGVDGYQVARHVKQSPASAEVPVLLLTGAFEPIDEERARETGCDGVLVKPFEPRQLIKTVRELLAGARSAELWPADMPRLEPGSARPAGIPAAPAMPVAPAMPAMTPAVPDAPVIDDGAHVLSVAYEAEADPDLAAALARLEFVAVPEKPALPDADALEPHVPGTHAAPADPRAPSLEWDLSAAPAAAGGARPIAGGANQSLANVFSALLAAERQNPGARASIAASPALSEAAVEEVVQKVVRRMTDELVRKIVLETAERLIREEIARIKA